MVREGELAPDFELLDQDRNPVRLSDLSGSQVILYFYPKADTPGCTREACSFRDSWNQFENRDVTVLGVSLDTPDEIRAFKEKHDLPFRLLSDTSGEVAREYDSFAETEIDGELEAIASRNTFLLDEDRHIERIYEGVSPDSHVRELVDDLDKLDT